MLLKGEDQMMHNNGMGAGTGHFLGLRRADLEQ
jgi:hypothetical protein